MAIEQNKEEAPTRYAYSEIFSETATTNSFNAKNNNAHPSNIGTGNKLAPPKLTLR